MIRVAALTSGKNLPSTRFRVRQHIEPLRSYQIHVDEYVPIIEKGRKVPLLPDSIKPRYVPPLYAAWIGVKASTRLPGMYGSWTHQITWLQRELIPGLYTLERFLKTPIVFDVDDAIWTTSMLGERTNRAIAQRAEVVVAGNSYLADWYSQHTKDVRIVPTAVDTNRFVPIPPESEDHFVIGWTGSYGNLPYLEAIEPALKRFADRYPDALVRVICDRQPEFRLLNSSQWEFLPWSADVEVRSVQSMNVGLMPLEDNLWTRGKCSFKMLQYMSCGIPSVVSPVGMNQDILQMDTVGLAARLLDDWYEGIEFYYLNREEGARHGLTGRQVVMDHFSQQVIAQKIAAILQELV